MNSLELNLDRWEAIYQMKDKSLKPAKQVGSMAAKKVRRDIKIRTKTKTTESQIR